MFSILNLTRHYLYCFSLPLILSIRRAWNTEDILPWVQTAFSPPILSHVRGIGERGKGEKNLSFFHAFLRAWIYFLHLTQYRRQTRRREKEGAYGLWKDLFSKIKKMRAEFPTIFYELCKEEGLSSAFWRHLSIFNGRECERYKHFLLIYN